MVVRGLGSTCREGEQPAVGGAWGALGGSPPCAGWCYHGAASLLQGESREYFAMCPGCQGFSRVSSLMIVRGIADSQGAIGF
jgi:hypothetical protein